MPLDITFTLSDKDLERFQRIVDKAKSLTQDQKSASQIEKVAANLIKEARNAELPQFVGERLLKLQVLLDMINDKEWKLSEEERRQILSALAYFCDAEDLIPDHIPGIGFLDDAMYVEIVIRELRSEIESYEEFSRFRTAEEQRRKKLGLDIHVGREEWLADQRAVLHSRMRKNRQARAASPVWRMSLF